MGTGSPQKMRKPNNQERFPHEREALGRSGDCQSILRR
jgi:hypothetical protein